MKRFIGLVVFVFVGSAGLFAETYDLGSGLKLTEYSNGSYSLEDTGRGICYDLSIRRESGNTFSVRVGELIQDKVTEYGIKKAISYVLANAGMLVVHANIAAGAIVNIFSISSAQ